MNKNGLRRVFSLLLAVMMVCALLPTAAFAEDVAEPQAAAEENRAIQYAFVLKFDAKGGVGAFGDVTQMSDMQPYDQFKMIQIPADYIPTREGYTFKGWKDTNGYGAVYQPGDNVNVNRTNSGCAVTDNSCTMTLYAVWEADTPPQPDKPAAPTKDWVIEQYKTVTVKCTSKPTEHGEKSYDLTNDDSIVIGKVEDGTTAGTYTCFVTVSAASYVNKFNETHEGHTAKNQSVSMQILYANGTWFVPSNDSGIIPIVFNVECNEASEPPKAPDAPSYEDLSRLIGDITVKCTNTSASHAPLTGVGYGLREGSYTTGNVGGNAESGYTYTVTIKSETYVTQFDTDTSAAHTPKDDEATVELEYKDKAWAVKSGTPVSFNVACVTEIVPPTKPTLEELRELLGQVTVDCTTSANHPDKQYDLIEGSYTANGTEHSGAYICAVSVSADKYVEAYNKEYPGHTLAGGTADHGWLKMVYLTRVKTDTGYTWSVSSIPAKPDVLTFNVVCEDVPAETFTVTYTDGVDSEEVFKDQVSKDLTSGTDTPAFKGTPKREGYKFTGWKPEVAKTVTEDVTYTAQWEKVEQTFTVTYKDGAKGKAFKEQVYKDLIYGVDTPAFDGKPTRKGYTFAGWTPKVADTVTKDVTYTATWKSTSGKDNVPKTGDGEIVMILGSVLLFSFCGAAAVCVFDRKRKQG